MAKTITRTITTGYNYNAFITEGDNMKKVGSVTVKEQPRSRKAVEAILTENKLDTTAVLVLSGTTEKLYKMSEEDFIKNSAEVKDEPAETAKTK